MTNPHFEPFRTLVFWVLALTLGTQPALAYGASTFTTGSRLTEQDWADHSGSLHALPEVDPAIVDSGLELLEFNAFETARSYEASAYLAGDLVDALDFDPVKAFSFVRDRIRFEPYRGVLRGAAGALGGRAGNSFDQALLLKQLLEDMGYDARLAVGSLDDDDALQLLRQSLAKPIKHEEIGHLAKLAGFSVEARNRMFQRAHRDFSRLLGALGDVEFPGERKSKTIAGIRDHAWVQARIDGEWQDLDPSFPDAEPGYSATTPDRFSSDFDESLSQTVAIRIIAESVNGSETSESVLLEETWLARDAVDSRVFLAFSPSNPALGGTLTSALSDRIDFIPVLMVDGDIVRGQRIPGLRAPESEASGFLFGESDTALSALYLEIRIGMPGGSVSDASRTVLMDRKPSRLRQAGQISINDLNPLPIDKDRPAAFRAIHQILVSNGGRNPRIDAENVGLAISYYGKNIHDSDSAGELGLDAVMWPASMIRQAQLAVNERIVVDALNDRPDVRFFIGEPRVYVMSLESRLENDRYRISSTIDLAHDPVYAASTGRSPSDAIGMRRVWHGVLQSSFETTLSELQGIGVSGAESGTISASTRLSEQLVVLRNETDDRIATELPMAARQDLLSGKLVIASVRELEEEFLSWWSVAADGTTRAMLRPARGGSEHFWWQNYRDPRLPRPRGGPARVSYANPEALDRYNREAIQRDRARKINNQTKATAEQRIRNSKKAPRARRGGGGIEYGTVVNISIFSILGVAGILAVTVVAVAIIGMLYMLGYVMLAERRRRAGEYWGPP